VQHGFDSPQRPYEGRFGFFETHMQEHVGDVDVASIGAGLGSEWTLLDTAIKPYPVCHFIHGAAEAALLMHAERGDRKIARIRCELPAPTLHIVAEPAEAKRVPRTDYEAKFSAHFVVATCLLRGRFGLAELSDASLADPEVLALCQRIDCVEEHGSAFPRHFSGAVSVTLESGEVLRRRIPVNLGSGERALSRQDIVEKFRGTAGVTLPAGRVDEVLGVLLSASHATPVRTITAALAG
jgi:2-methylcitrate dehydratase PrpD